MTDLYPCPCCGYVVLDEPGSYDICPICFWEDDIVQLRWPDMAGGANKVSLIEAQKNYIAHGVSELRLLRHVRPPRQDEKVERGWRTIDVELDVLESSLPGTRAWPDYDRLYWWRPDYWLRHGD